MVLREGALSTDRAQYLVEQAVEGTPFAINVFGAVEVLLDQRRTYEQTMLVHHRLEDVDNPLIVGNGAPVACCTRSSFGCCWTGEMRRFGNMARLWLGLPRIGLTTCFLATATSA